MDGPKTWLEAADENARFRILVESITDYAVYMLDAEGVVATWNPGAQRIKGYLGSEIVGKHFSSFYTEEDRVSGLPKRALDTAAREGRFESEGWRLRKDGSRFWTHVIIDPIRDPDGELVGFAKITRDLSERKKAEAALAEQQLRLGQAKEELFQAQKVEAIGQLTGGVAHDFNNLLMVVLGSLEALGRRVSLDERDRKLLDNATQAAQRGAQLTQRMLAFARRQELEQRPVDLPELVRGMSDLLARTLGPSIMIETRFPIILPQVLADPNQLDSVLLNLAVNARDAMPNGGPLIISAREQLVSAEAGGLAPGRYVCLAVEDRGEGMDEATLARAIDPFFTTKGIGKGTGLGLSMVQGIAEQSGGRLILKSRKGEGTTAEIWLPVVEDHVAAAAIEPAPAAVAQPQERRFKVLAVDDDALVLLNTAMMLEELGHQVLEATSGEQALRLLDANPDIDVVVTDQAMPRMTGLELAAEIGTRRPGLPIILASGYADIEEARVMKLPRLAKPFGQHDLERIIARVTEADELSQTG